MFKTLRSKVIGTILAVGLLTVLVFGQTFVRIPTGSSTDPGLTFNYNRNIGGTIPVGTFPSNSLGLHDMSGNVWEWVQDKKNNYSGVGSQNPINERFGYYRLFRGGSWYNGSRDLRCSKRGNGGSSYKRNYLGFRLLRLR